MALGSERRTATEAGRSLSCLWEGVDRVCPWHRPDPGQKGMQTRAGRLLRVHAPPKDCKHIWKYSSNVFEVLYIANTIITPYSNSACMRSVSRRRRWLKRELTPPLHTTQATRRPGPESNPIQSLSTQSNCWTVASSLVYYNIIAVSTLFNVREINRMIPCNCYCLFTVCYFV